MKYFADLPVDDLIPKLGEKIRGYHDHLEQTGLGAKRRRSYDLYYGRHIKAGSGMGADSPVDVGRDGELKAYPVNHYRNLIRHGLALTTSQKPAYNLSAKKPDLKSQTQTKLGRNIFDHYLKKKRLIKHQNGAAERALVMAKGYLYMCWDRHAGTPIMPDLMMGGDGQPVLDDDGHPRMKLQKSGDVFACALSSFDVIYDYKLTEWENAEWVVVREYKNKWALATQYPEKFEEITRATGRDEYAHTSSSLLPQWFVRTEGEDNDDIIPIYTFYHRKSDALLKGRKTIFINGRITVEDGEMPYSRLPVFPIVAGEMFETCEGYTEAFDNMPLQDVLNVLYSIPFTNQQAFGVQTIWMPNVGEVTYTQLGKGLAMLKGGAPGTEPRALQLTATPAEIFTNQKSVEAAMEKISGINSVVRGEPDASLKSGIALGRVQAMAIQFASNFQKNWAELIEESGTFLFELLKQNLSHEMEISLSASGGRSSKSMTTTFKRDDIQEIDRVDVEIGNPIANTVAGRLELAESFLEKRAITVPQYFEVLNTGQFDSILEGPKKQQEAIRQENEWLSEGKPVRAMATDKHTLHASEHLAVINDPMIRDLVSQGDELATQVMMNTLTHIDEHAQMSGFPDPMAFYALINGEPPPPPPPGPPLGPDGQPMPPLPPEGGGGPPIGAGPPPPPPPGTEPSLASPPPVEGLPMGA